MYEYQSKKMEVSYRHKAKQSKKNPVYNMSIIRKNNGVPFAKEKAVYVPIIQRDTIKEEGMKLFNEVSGVIPDGKIITMDDLKYGNTLAIINLNDVIARELPAPYQMHMHIKGSMVDEQKRKTDIAIRTNKYFTIEFIIDIKLEATYLLYLTKQNHEKIDQFIAAHLSDDTMERFTKLARQAFLSKYYTDNGRYDVSLLTGREQYQLGDYFRM